MSAEFYNPPSMSEVVAKAQDLLRTLSKSEHLDIMVKAGVMTKAQAERGKRNIAKAEAKTNRLKQ